MASLRLVRQVVKDYASAGVDIDLEGKAVRAIVSQISHTLSKTKGEPGEDLSGIGHFCSLIRIDGKTAFAIATDGVGSKIKVAEALRRFDTIGIDLVAMNVNDLICAGAKPMTLVDYLAMEKPDPYVTEEVGKGLAAGADEAGISISGGELATLPEIIKGVDLAGTAVGTVEIKKIISGAKTKPEDVVIGLASSGIHSNGLTLARRVLLDHYSIDERVFGDKSVGEELLTPTKIYVREVMELIDKVEVRGLANITGGGLGNLQRITKHGFTIDNLPKPQKVFREIQRLEGIRDKEMYRTFNMGVGFCIVVEEADAKEAVKTCKKHGTDAWELGRAVKEHGVKVKDFTLTY